MASMIPLDPAIETTIGNSGWKFVATAAGRYATGLRATVQLWDPIDKAQGSDIINLDSSRERGDVVSKHATTFAIKSEDAERGLLDIAQAIEGAFREGPQPANPDEPADSIPYKIMRHGLVWMRATKEGPIPTRLTNFTAEIVADTLIDDGAETWRTFTIDAAHNGQRFTFAVPVARFSNMTWPMEHLGAGAIISPGNALRDHARAAVQSVSESIEKRHVYAHTGWRNIDGVWLYLHAGGAIGAGGLVEGVEVQADSAISGYDLPAPPQGQDLKRAVACSFDSLNVAPHAISLPLYATIWRSTLDTSSYSIHIAGPTGEGKTALAALSQQHFGAKMDAHHLPANWTSTANALEAIAFATKDAILVVDEFTPTDSAQS